MTAQHLRFEQRSQTLKRLIDACRLAHRHHAANQWGPCNPKDFEVEDFAAAFIRFADGSPLSLEASWPLKIVEQEVCGVWLHGTAGGIRWPELKLAHVQDGVLVDTQVVSNLGTDGHKNEQIAFVEAILHDEPSPVPPEPGLVVAELLEALYQSAEAGREVRLDSPNDVRQTPTTSSAAPQTG